MSDDPRILYRGVEPNTCNVLDDETFAEHVRRCSCDFSADRWAELLDLVDAREWGEKDGAWLDGASAEQVGDRLANAIASAFQALRKVRRLAHDAQRHDRFDHVSIAEVAFRAAALDGFMADPDRLALDGADTRRAVWDLLEHVGNITDYEPVKPFPLAPVPAGLRSTGEEA